MEIYNKAFNVMKDKICHQCGTILIIDEWEGWIWRCFNCNYEGEKATDEEIEEFEQNREYWTKGEIEEAKKEASEYKRSLIGNDDKYL